ncbi:MAG: hypothetical protein AAGA29_04915 [Planctomycetota bacterium]
MDSNVDLPKLDLLKDRGTHPPHTMAMHTALAPDAFLAETMGKVLVAIRSRDFDEVTRQVVITGSAIEGYWSDAWRLNLLPLLPEIEIANADYLGGHGLIAPECATAHESSRNLAAFLQQQAHEAEGGDVRVVVDRLLKLYGLEEERAAVRQAIKAEHARYAQWVRTNTASPQPADGPPLVLDDIVRETLEILVDQGRSFRASAMASELRRSEKTARKYLDQLVEKGLVHKHDALYTANENGRAERG